MIIYKITNKINGRIYIGQTTYPLSYRWSQHKSAAYRGSKYLIHKTIHKNGADNFTVEEIAKCSSMDELNAKEIELIKTYNTLVPNGYNLNLGGSNALHSEYTKKKLSRIKTGTKVSDATRKILSIAVQGPNNPRFGAILTQETKNKISASQKGRPSLKKGKPGKPHTEWSKLKISISGIGQKRSLGFKHDENFKQGCRERITKRNIREVKNTETGELFNSVKEAAVALNMKYSTLVGMLNGTNPNKTLCIYTSNRKGYI